MKVKSLFSFIAMLALAFSISSCDPFADEDDGYTGECKLGQIYGGPDDGKVESGTPYALNVQTSYGSNWTFQWTSDHQGDVIGTPTASSTSFTPGNVTSDTPVKIICTGKPDCGGTQTAERQLIIVPKPKYFTVTGPKSGDQWQKNTPHTISWQSVGITGNVMIQYDKNDDNWHPIIEDTGNDGSYSWTVADDPSTTARIKVSSVNDPSIYDYSGKFSIITEPPPSKYNVYIDWIRFDSTPQSGTWLFCWHSSIYSLGQDQPFHIPNQEYQGDGVVIHLNLVFTGTSGSDSVAFWIGLDDDEANVCDQQNHSAEDEADNAFTTFIGEHEVQYTGGDWNFTIHYRTVKQ